MKKLLSIILSITMLLSSAIIVSADELFTTTATEVTVEKTTEFTGKIKVGINAEFPPFAYYENDEQKGSDFALLKGFDIELMNTIGDYIGYEIEYFNMDFDKLIPAVVSGEVDCAISAITVTEQRESVVDFTNAYLSSSDIRLSTPNQENYAIVFQQDADAKAKAEGKDSAYLLVSNAIVEMINDGTIDKLIDKYGLNKALESEDGVGIEYYTVKVAPGAAENIDKEDNSQSETPKVYETTPVYLPSDWAAESVANAKNIGIIESTKVYDYKKPITREEFCEIIYNYCANVVGMLETVDYESKFTDTDNTHITILNAMGIINGKSETTFAPNDSLTREEAAVILERMVNKTVPVEVTELYFEFDDGNDISEWADSSIQVMCNMGVMNGVGNNKFAPKDTYTTEQAIATVMRVYDAQIKNLAGNNSDVGIIGGADGPTSVIVSSTTPVENTTEIVIGDDVAVDDFYIDEAIKLSTDAGKMAADKTFISMYVSKDVADEVYGKLDNIDYAKPNEMYYLSFNPDKVVEFYEELYAKEDIDAEIDIAKALEYQKFNLSVFANMINGRYGANTLAATSVLTNRKGYVMPKDFKGDFGVYMVYEGEYSVLVTFSEIGENVIEGRMQYVKNGEKADILPFMSEVYSSFGEECITIGKVK